MVHDGTTSGVDVDDHRDPQPQSSGEHHRGIERGVDRRAHAPLWRPSVDADGQIVMHRWTVNGQVLVGKDVMLMLEATEVTLTVIDEHGGKAMTSTKLTPASAQPVQNLEAVHDGAGSVPLTGRGPGSVTHVARGLDWRDHSTAFTDNPPMSGVNTYTVQPVGEERPSSVERTSGAGHRRRVVRGFNRGPRLRTRRG